MIMQKGRIILIMIIVFAIASGMLAFKVEKFNITPVYTPIGTSTYISGTFSRTVLVCTTTTPFFTNEGLLSTVYSTTISGVITKTIPGGPSVTVTFLGCHRIRAIVTMFPQ
jgi:hypothetical protein